MATYTHLLVASDFSESAKAALTFAALLAQRLDATATLAHVYDSSPFRFGFSSPPSELAEQMRETAKRELDKLKETLYSTIKDVRTMAIDAESTSVAIAEHARACGADLVVVGTRGRSTVARLLMGSVAEGIVRLAHCDVLTIPPGSDDSHMPSGLLAPTDFSDGAASAIERAQLLAADLGARLTVLHVFDPGIPVPAPDPAARLFLPVEEVEAQLRAALDKLHKTRLGGSTYVDLDLVVASSHAEGIVTYADEHRVGLVVVGSFGQSALARFLIGSVAERVVRAAHCPVLTVKTKAAPQGS
jgi:nucleotide-binding universal stress UspA family protein